MGCNERQDKNNSEPHQSTDDTEHDSFGKKLEEDEIIFCAKRFLNAYYIGALFYGNEHDVCNAESAHEDGEPSDDPARHANHSEQAGNLVADELGFIKRKIVFFFRMQPADG